MKITLKRNIDVDCFRIRADLLMHSEMNHIIPVLVHANEHNGIATAESLTDSLFPKFNLISEKILEICVEYELMDELSEKQYSVTEKGERAIKDRMVFAPKDGTWDIYHTTDDLIDTKYQILEIKSAEDRVVYGGGKFDQNQPALEDLSYDIEKLKGHEIVTTLGTKARFIIKNIDQYQKRVSTRTAVLSWSISENESHLSVDGHHMKDISVKYRTIWKELLERADIGDAKWDWKHDRLLVKYDDVSPTDRIHMKQTVTIDGYTDDYGDFESQDMSLPIYPRYKRDAQKWAEYLTVTGINDYQTQKRYQKLTTNVQRKFSGFDVVIPERSAISKKDMPRRWYVQAMEDWGL